MAMLECCPLVDKHKSDSPQPDGSGSEDDAEESWWKGLRESRLDWDVPAKMALNDEIRQQTNNANNDDGANAIFNIFAQNPDVLTFFDMQLSRSNDPGDTSSGSFIVGSHVSGFENVSSQPHLPVINPGRWAVPLDQMSVNGKAFQFNQSVVPGVPSGKILVDIDSGFSFPPIPSTAVDFIYSSFGITRG